MNKALSRIVGALGAALLMTAIVLVVALPEQTVGDPETVEAALKAGLSQPTTTISEDPIEEIEGIEEPSEQSPAIAPNERSRLEEVAAVAGSQPTRLRIGAIDVDASITSAGVDIRTGQMEVPRNVRDVAWYQHGSAPGEAGSAVLAAHVDLASQGAGVFFNLRRLEPGDLIDVAYDNGTREQFRVAARTVYDKDELPVDAIFSREGPPVLTLITCGGGFNTTVQSYDSNVVVYAVPVTSVAPTTQVF